MDLKSKKEYEVEKKINRLLTKAHKEIEEQEKEFKRKYGENEFLKGYLAGIKYIASELEKIKREDLPF